MDYTENEQMSMILGAVEAIKYWDGVADEILDSSIYAIYEMPKLCETADKEADRNMIWLEKISSDDTNWTSSLHRVKGWM